MVIHLNPIHPLNEVDCVWQTHTRDSDVEGVSGDLFDGFLREVWLIEADSHKRIGALAAFSSFAGVRHLQEVFVPCGVKGNRAGWKFHADIPVWDDLFQCKPGKLGDFDAPDECDLDHFELGRIVAHVPSQKRIALNAAKVLVKELLNGQAVGDFQTAGDCSLINEAVADMAAYHGLPDPLQQEEEADD